MHVLINGEARELPDGTTAAELVELLELQGQRLALEVNEEIVPRGSFAAHRFNPGDKIEIVHAIGGG